MKKLYIIILLLVIFPYCIFAEEEIWDIPLSRGFGKTLVHGLIATGEIILKNRALMLGNYVYGFSWAIPTRESVYLNFTRPWQWEDTDGFIVNFLAHPYQGSYYFNAGRVNGFGFYWNLLFTAFGSAHWEALCEQQHASVNDFIYSAIGGVSIGEILYRLHMEAYSAGIPLPFIFAINPIGGIHILFSNNKPPETGFNNLHRFQIYIGGGYSSTHSSIETNQKIFSQNGGFGGIGAHIVYGDPFVQYTHVPYRHFEIDVALGMSPGIYQDIRLISDGYIFSFSPVFTDISALSTGLSLHLDFRSQGRFNIEDSTINQSSNALNWTIKYQRNFSQNTVLELKGHTGFIFMGSSKYYVPNSVISTETLSSKNDLNNYGGGVNVKLFFTLANKTLGMLDAELYYYHLWTYPGTVHFSRGNVYWLFADLTYSYMITPHFSAGIAASFAIERGTFKSAPTQGYPDGFPNTRKTNYSAKLFVAWNL